MNENIAGQVEPRHPIGAVAERTGLTPEVLRVWERRYGAVEPARTEGGQRLYSDAEVEKLRLLRRATSGGRSIGAVATLPVDELARLVRDDDEARASRRTDEEPVAPVETVDAAMDAVRRMDGDGLERRLRRAAVLFGAPAFLERIAAPVLRQLGDEWHAGRISPAHEHLATRVIQRVVMSALADLRVAEDAPAIVLASPAGDRHEMGALLAAAAAATEQWRVIYLGADLPAADIAATAHTVGARAIGISAVFVGDGETLLQELQELRRLVPPSMPLVAGGRASLAMADELRDAGWLVIADLDELRATLHGWSSGDG